MASILVSGCGSTPSTSTAISTATPTATPDSPAEAHEQLRACITNLKNLATAYEIYSSDFQNRYPDLPSKVTPNYLKVLPACPTNNQAYRIESTGATPPDAYTF